MKNSSACQKYGLKFGFSYSSFLRLGEANRSGMIGLHNPGRDRNLHVGRNWWTLTRILSQGPPVLGDKAIRNSGSY